MRKSKKLRADSKLAALHPDSRAELDARMLSGCSLSDAVDWVRDAHGITMSEQAMSNYYRTHVLSNEWKRNAQAASTLAKLKTSDIKAATHNAVAQTAFTLATRGDVPLDELTPVYQLLLKGQKLQQDAEKIDIMKNRAAEALLDKAQSDEVQRIVGDDSSRSEKIASLKTLLFGEI